MTQDPPEFAAPATPPEESPATHAAGAVQPRAWRYAPDAWRWARRLDLRYVDMLFRTRTARVIPHAARSRFHQMGLPAEVVDETLGQIRRADGWASGWLETAQRYLGDSRRQVSAGNIPEAAQARQVAALCYHAAQVFSPSDPRTVRQCRAAAASLFTQGLPHLHPHARHLWVPWRTRSLPAYFQVPEPSDTPAGLVVMLNGASMSKEETFGWSARFLERNYAVLDLDSPGTGEATGVADAAGDQDDIIDGVFTLFANEPGVDLGRVVVVGTSLGANQAIRVAAHERRVMAVVAVTPPYDPARWLHRASPLLQMELGLLAGGKAVPHKWDEVDDFSLVDVAPSVRQPVLIFGGGRDVIVPPNEAQLLATALGDRATLVWYPQGGHCLYEAMDQWTFEAAAWIDAVAGVLHAAPPATPVQAAAAGRVALETAEWTPRRTQELAVEDDDEFFEYARVIDPDDEPGESGRSTP